MTNRTTAPAISRSSERFVTAIAGWLQAPQYAAGALTMGRLDKFLARLNKFPADIGSKGAGDDSPAPRGGSRQ